MMEIRVFETTEMVNIVCQLVKRGFGFTVDHNGKTWIITLTGGF